MPQTGTCEYFQKGGFIMVEYVGNAYTEEVEFEPFYGVRPCQGIVIPFNPGIPGECPNPFFVF